MSTLERHAGVEEPAENPLAGGLDDAETAGGLEPGELLDEGKTADQWDDEELED